MVQLPNYSQVEILAEAPPAEYGTHERRADILDRVLDAGSPRAVNKSELARRYDVHRNTINRDFDRLSEHLADALDPSDVHVRVRAAFERAQQELFDSGEPREAWRVTREWASWLADVGVIETESARAEVDVTQREAATETEHYKLITDDGEDVPVGSDYHLPEGESIE